jgi:hypothetical protein
VACNSGVSGEASSYRNFWTLEVDCRSCVLRDKGLCDCTDFCMIQCCTFLRLLHQSSSVARTDGASFICASLLADELAQSCQSRDRVCHPGGRG